MYIWLDIDHFIIILIDYKKQQTIYDGWQITYQHQQSNLYNVLYVFFLLVYIFGGVFYFPVIQVLFCQLIFTAHAFVL